MQLKSYPSAGAFLAAAQPFLEMRETINSVMLGLALRLKERGEKQQNAYYTVETSDQVIAAAMMTPPYRTNVSSVQDGDAIVLLARAFHNDGWAVAGVNGVKSTARAFAEAWSLLTGQGYTLAHNMRLYDLVKVVPAPTPSGYMRLATRTDLDLLVEWTIAFDQEAAHDGVIPDRVRQGLIDRLPYNELYLWDDHGPVAMAARSRPTRHSMSVNAVYTPPILRRRGYATALVAGITQTILDDGYPFALLFTDLTNPTSNSIYQKIGYRPITDFDSFAFSK